MNRRSLAAGLPLLLGVLLLLLACQDDVSVPAACPAELSISCICGNGAPMQRCRNENLTGCVCESALPADAGTPPVDAAQLVDSAQVLDAGPPGPAADGGNQVDASCGMQTSAATLKEARPVDVIFVIDNSGSMSDEIAAVEANINDNFARILDQVQADYRVILLSHHGSSSSQLVCIKAPLSGTTCSPIPSAPVNTARFFHYDQDVQSTDSWCWLLDTFDQPDRHLFTATGWQAWLRPSALKVFVEVSDDGVYCSSPRGTFYPSTGTDPNGDAIRLAQSFHAALLNLSPTQFGTQARPNYVWHSVVGMNANTPAELPWLPGAPLQTGICSSAYDSGAAYQMLSSVTGGLRYPVCEGAGFETVFRAIAREVVQGAGAECRFRIPEPPLGKYIDLTSIAVEYRPGGTGAAQRLTKVEPAACTDAAFTIVEQEVVLCDAACARVRQDNSAKLQVVYGCGAEGGLK